MVIDTIELKLIMTDYKQNSKWEEMQIISYWHDHYTLTMLITKNYIDKIRITWNN